MIFLTKEFLAQINKGKIEIKNYKGDHHEFWNF
jgi:hypothetical protein